MSYASIWLTEIKRAEEVFKRIYEKAVKEEKRSPQEALDRIEAVLREEKNNPITDVYFELVALKRRDLREEEKND